MKPAYLLVLILWGCVARVAADGEASVNLRLSVFARGLEGDRLYVGEPLRVGVLLETAGRPEPVRLTVPEGAPWSAAVRVRLHDEAGRVVLAPALLVNAQEPSVQDVAAGAPVAALWRWPAEALAELPPGRYRLSARLLSPSPGQPPLALAETSLELVPAPVSPSPAQRARWLALLAHDAFLAGDSSRATTLVDVALGLQADQPEAQRLRQALTQPARVRTVSLAAQGPTRAQPAAAPSATPTPVRTSVPVPTPDAGLQWAIKAEASSEYRATDYSRSRATGAPDVPRLGDHGRAWAPKGENGGVEWLELTYERPVRATEVRVIQSFNPGALMAVDLRFVDGTSATVWQGPDATVYPAGAIGVLRVAFPRTEKPVERVRLTLDTRRVKGWNEIDAVALIGEP